MKTTKEVCGKYKTIQEFLHFGESHYRVVFETRYKITTRKWLIWKEETYETEKQYSNIEFDDISSAKRYADHVERCDTKLDIAHKFIIYPNGYKDVADFGNFVLNPGIMSPSHKNWCHDNDVALSFECNEWVVWGSDYKMCAYNWLNSSDHTTDYDPVSLVKTYYNFDREPVKNILTWQDEEK